MKYDLKLWTIDYEARLSVEDVEFWDKFDQDETEEYQELVKLALTRKKIYDN